MHMSTTVEIWGTTVPRSELSIVEQQGLRYEYYLSNELDLDLDLSIYLHNPLLESNASWHDQKADVRGPPDSSCSRDY
jgi:hypothetical protein